MQKTHQIVAAFLAVLTLLSQGTVSLPAGIPPEWGTFFVSWDVFFLKCYVCASPFLLAGGDNQVGFFTSKPVAEAIKEAPKAVMMLLALCLVVLAMTPARAADRSPDALINQLRAKEAALVVAKAQTPAEFNAGTSGSGLPSTQDNLFAGLADPFKELANFLASDFVSAAALSTSIPGLIDGNGHDCWVTMQGAGAILKAHPIPLTLHAATDLEALRLFNAEALKVCQAPQCTQVFAELTHGIQTLMPVSAPVPIQISDICSKIPPVAMVPPTLPDPGAPVPPGVLMLPPPLTSIKP